MKKIVILLIIILPFQAHAEPSTTVKYLMNDSVSIFEWGLYRLEESIKEQKFDKELDIMNDSGYVDYNWDTNRINLTKTIYPRYSRLTKLGAKKMCRAALTTIKRRYGNGVDKKLREFFGINKFFMHKGYKSLDEPKSLLDDIENMTNIKVQVYASKTNEAPFSEQISCTSKIHENDTYFIDNEKKQSKKDNLFDNP